MQRKDVSLMFYRALIYSSFNAISGFCCTSVLSLIKAVLMRRSTIDIFRVTVHVWKGLQRTPAIILLDLDTTFTFLGEKVLGIFAGHYEFARDTPQQLNDQCYMVYNGGVFARGEGEKTRHRTELSDRVPSRAHCESVDGGWRVEG